MSNHIEHIKQDLEWAESAHRANKDFIEQWPTFLIQKLINNNRLLLIQIEKNKPESFGSKLRKAMGLGDEI